MGLNSITYTDTSGFANYTPPKLGDPCRSCRERKSTSWWAGDTGVLGFSHGMALPWCEVCTTKAQLKYARDCAKRIPELERQLRRARRNAKGVDTNG